MMKKTLSLIGIYFLVLIFGTILFATIFMLGSDLTTVVSGQNITFFSVPFFITGVQMAFPLVSIFAGLLLILYLIRHPGNQILSLITYAALGILTWGLFIPIDLSALETSEVSIKDYRKKVTSPGVFRKEESGVFFYTKVDDNGYADGVFIDINGFSSQEGNIVAFENLKTNNDNAFPYSDILIKESIEPPEFVTYPLAVYNALLTAALNSFSKGIAEWLCFATMAFALLAVYSIQFLSSWKLTSALSVITGGAVIIFINYFYYIDFFPKALKDFSSYISGFIPATNPIIAFINIVLGILLILYGIVMGIYRTNEKNMQEDSL